jgi:hypothetical protein
MLKIIASVSKSLRRILKHDRRNHACEPQSPLFQKVFSLKPFSLATFFLRL